MSAYSMTRAPSEASVYWRSSQRCMEVNVLLDNAALLGGGGRKEEGG